MASAALILCVLTGCSRPVQIDDRETIAAHRRFELLPVRGIETCGDPSKPVWRDLVAFPDNAEIRLTIDWQGKPTVDSIELRLIEGWDEAPCYKQLVRAQVQTWRYTPFTRYLLPVKAHVSETVAVLPSERWRTPRVPFPEVPRIEDVRITLERHYGLGLCEGNRAYKFELAGDGALVVSGIKAGPREQPTSRLDSTIDRRVFTALFEQFRAADFYSLLESYMYPVTDQSGYRLTLDIAGQRAQVSDYLGEPAGMPPVVKTLERAVLQAAGMAAWPCETPGAQ